MQKGVLVVRVYKPQFEETSLEIMAISKALSLIFVHLSTLKFNIFDEATEGALTDTYQHF